MDHPSQASSYLEPLLDFAAQQIPSDKHMETPLYILATAGMRMLSLADQESILDDLRVDIPLKYNFHFISSHVEVITGKQEGDEICFIFFPLPMIVSLDVLLTKYTAIKPSVCLSIYLNLKNAKNPPLYSNY